MKNAIISIINDLKSLIGHLEELQNTQEQNGISPKDVEKKVTIEEVRAILAEKSKDGKVKEVKALIKKHGADKLTALNPDCYKEILKEAKKL
ncbi:MAG: hypothetical protein GX309_04560 [Clostridiales bacterium]|nr:hypothetical protein [Clostridiales bacterium]